MSSRADFRCLSLEPAPGTQDAPPLPLVGEAAAGVEVVRGLYCGRNHFNDPRARYCATCGLGMVQTSFRLLEGVRPPLGLLVLDNGESHAIKGNLVLGRDPLSHRMVQAGEASGLLLSAADAGVSRQHALVLVADWDLQLLDLSSKNGTFLWDECSRSWERLTPQRPVALRPGRRMAFGPVTAVLESSLRSPLP